MTLGRIQLAAMAAIVFAAATARGQEAPSDPAPSAASSPPAEYPAPLYQRTQPSYVPQSIAMSGPRVLGHWAEGEPIPPGYHVTTRMRVGLVVAGSVVLGTLWLMSALVATAAEDSRTPGAAMWVPFVGPFVQLGYTSSATSALALVIDGVGQTSGAAMLLVGLTSPKKLLVRNDLAVRVRPVPMVFGRGGGGFGFAGSF